MFLPMVLSDDIIEQRIGIGTYLFIFVTFFSVRYIIEDNKLTIKFFGIKWHFISINRVDRISSIERHDSLLHYWGAGVANAFRALKIKVKNGEWPCYFFTPANERLFVETLKEINPNMTIDIDTKPKVWWRFWDWDI
jgi:hypothetical protein